MEGPGTRYVLCQDRTAISKIKITWGCPGPAMAAEQMGPDVTFTPILEDLSQPRFPPHPPDFLGSLVSIETDGL